VPYAVDAIPRLPEANMSRDNQAKLRRIKRASAAGRVTCDLVLAALGLTGIGAVVDVVSGIGGVKLLHWFFSTAGLGLGHRLILGAITAATWGILFAGFFHLRRLFADFARGEIFTRHAVRQLRWFGIACLLWCVMHFVWMASLAMSSHPIRTFPASADGFGTGIVVIVIAWFMDMAVDLREENELTI
jgi:hypothetical protein